MDVEVALELPQLLFEQPGMRGRYTPALFGGGVRGTADGLLLALLRTSSREDLSWPRCTFSTLSTAAAGTTTAGSPGNIRMAPSGSRYTPAPGSARRARIYWGRRRTKWKGTYRLAAPNPDNMRTATTSKKVSMGRK